MLWYFMQHPRQYWVPVLVNLVVLILSARFFKRFYKGEARILLDPTIIFGAAVLWPMTDMGILVATVFWLMGRTIGFVIGKVDERK